MIQYPTYFKDLVQFYASDFISFMCNFGIIVYFNLMLMNSNYYAHYLSYFEF